MASKRDYYEVLGVSREASAAEIKKAYKKLAVAHHPDRNIDDKEAATERFKEVREAFDVLGDAGKRSQYDQFGHQATSGAGFGGGGGGGFEDIFGAFGDLFGGGGGGGRRSRQQRAQQGQSLGASVTIDLLEAAKGCEHLLDVTRQELCGTCDGSGAAPGSQRSTCDYCSGHGQVVQSQGFFRVQTTCPACQGEGSVIRDKCRSCKGSGREAKKVRLKVQIPAGVDSGMRLCLRGEGEPGPNGGPRGDLYVEIQLEEHPFFEREGNDLICRIPITYTQAALGAMIEVPTLDGKHDFKIPAGTQPGEQFELRNYGMPDPHGGRRKGNLVVLVQVEVPQKLTSSQEELLRQLADVENTEVSSHRQSFFKKLTRYFSSHDAAKK